MIRKLQFISQQNEQYTHLESIEAALKAGIRWVQLRMKGQNLQEIETQGHQARTLCDDYNATLVINDHPTIAQVVSADGVHLGKDDMPVAVARKMMGNKMIIGATANTFDDIASLAEQGADYIGLGPFRFTTTKQKLSPVLGVAGYRSILTTCKERNIAIPVIAIGGIEITDIPTLLQTGVYGIAASSMVLNSENTLDAVQQISDIINQQIDYANNR